MFNFFLRKIPKIKKSTFSRNLTIAKIKTPALIGAFT
jgi:hypothetical protein